MVSSSHHKSNPITFAPTQEFMDPTLYPSLSPSFHHTIPYKAKIHHSNLPSYSPTMQSLDIVSMPTLSPVSRGYFVDPTTGGEISIVVIIAVIGFFLLALLYFICFPRKTRYEMQEWLDMESAPLIPMTGTK